MECSFIIKVQLPNSSIGLEIELKFQQKNVAESNKVMINVREGTELIHQKDLSFQHIKRILLHSLKEIISIQPQKLI